MLCRPSLLAFAAVVVLVVLGGCSATLVFCRVDALPPSSLETYCFLDVGVSFYRFSGLVVSRFVGSCEFSPPWFLLGSAF
jgi:hypothetical protein